MVSYEVYEERDTVLRNPKYQILNSRKGSFYFRLCARNGEIVLTSVNYGSKPDCIDALARVKDQADFNSVETKDETKKLFSFMVKTKDQQIVGYSENYTTKLGRGNGIMSVMKIICDAPAEDLTQ